MASIGKGSRDKGANYERELAKKLSELFGVAVKRTGAPERWKSHRGDLNAGSWENTILNDFFFELKKRETWNPLKWFKKAEDDNIGTFKKTLLIMSKNNESDYVFLRLDDFLKVLRELEGFRQESEPDTHH